MKSLHLSSLLLVGFLLLPTPGLCQDQGGERHDVKIRFRTNPSGLSVYQVVDGEPNFVLTNSDGRTNFPVVKGGLLVKFGLRSAHPPPVSPRPIPTDPSTYWLSNTTTVSKGEREAGTWPAPESPPYEVPIPADVKYYYQRDLWLGRIGPLGALLGCLLACLPFLELRYWRPGRQKRTLQGQRARVLETLSTRRSQEGDPNIGAQLDNYRISSFLGAGGMARVYRGMFNDTLDEEKPVAIKLMTPDNADSVEYRKRFYREAQVGRDLQHANVVRILDYGEHEGSLFMVMEYIEGTTLRDRCRQLTGGRAIGLDGATCWKYLEPVFRSLQYVHDQGIVHRDFKPENIMVTSDERVVLMDFGLARKQDFSMLTATGGLLGTPAYMAPEQIQGQDLDGRCDQYAMGIMIYEMVTGCLPFPGTTDPIQLLMKHISEEPRAPSLARPDVSEGLERVILKMLQKEPARRYRNLTDCASDLKPLLLRLGQPQLPAEGPAEEMGSQTVGPAPL